ncbi:hypothetical protein PMAYCL1PPCAC_17098 [Pristionchus mayeri]|uniref:Uncharacterized protein n=1 Tax=Pristionchus mayeri TaxID=1317129 RepID=A0AAN5HZZ9_9BILA|nr:hypothetical protein PMAYCL1PPCAC_17098 [Pristionchus mayeri]
MRFIIRPPRETFCDADWVSHVKVDLREEIDLSERAGVCDIRYGVIHLEVFKKPANMDSLPSEVFGSSMGGFSLEEGKEYLLCGGITEEGTLSCIGGQVKTESVEGMVAEWG